MQSRLARVAGRFWPTLSGMPAGRQAVGVGEVIFFFFFAPIALFGIIWLVRLTDLEAARSNVMLLLFIAALATLLNRLKYFISIRLQLTRFGKTEGSLAAVVEVSGIFIIGPIVLWIPVLLIILELVAHWDRALGPATRWRMLRQGAMDITSVTVAPLIALTFYFALGGTIPISGLEPQAFLLAVAALVVNFIVQFLLGATYLGYHARNQSSVMPMVSFFLVAVSVPQLAGPFGVLASGIYVESGLPAYLFFCTGLLAVAFLARRWSLAAEHSRQQSDALVELEGLGHDIITSIPEEERLPRLLAQHLPMMFPSGNLIVWRFPDQVLFRQPADWKVELDQVWPWMAGRSGSSGFLPNEQLPWDDRPFHENPILVTPILKDSQAIGAIYLSLHTLLPWDRDAIERLFPATQSLAALIASAFDQSQAYATDIRLERVSQELRLAGEIQSSLIPFDIPSVPGWRISVTLNPAEETFGDFFDLIPLPDGRLGLIIADVVDKGVGAALYMALSRTLLRTYAIEADSDPDLVFFATNSRMLADTSSSLFVTAFYGVLDPVSGQLAYSNAGHNPPYLVRPGEQVIIQELIRTGIPIGVQEGATWSKASVQLQPGDRLLLYTDGVPEADNGNGDYLTTGPMLEIAKENLDLSAEELQDRILQNLSDFVGDAPQSDDITLMILARDRLD